MRGAQEASPSTTAPASPAPRARHLACRVDVGLVLEQQLHHRLVAVQCSLDEARPSILPGADGLKLVLGGGVGWGGGCVGGNDIKERESDRLVRAGHEWDLRDALVDAGKMGQAE
jgi:hypothetical protein